jgi:hypothetical protein
MKLSLSLQPGSGTADGTPPDVPTGLQAAAWGYGVLELSWDSVVDITFKVYVNGSFHTATSPGWNTYTFNGTVGTLYSFQLRALDEATGLESALCAEVSAYPGAGSAPSNVNGPQAYVGDYGATASDGIWTADPSISSYTYSWTLNGTEIGETSNFCSYSAGGGGGGYFACIVTATNAVGSSSAESNSVYGIP